MFNINYNCCICKRKPCPEVLRYLNKKYVQFREKFSNFRRST